MTLYTFQLVLAHGEPKTVTVEANSFMQAFDAVVAAYPHYSTLHEMNSNVINASELKEVTL